METIMRISYDAQFTIIEEFASGGILRRHFLVNEHYVDYEEVFTIGWEQAEYGCRVDIMPILEDGNPMRDVIYYDGKCLKNPDLRINGFLHEVEQPLKPDKLNTLKHRIDKGAGQADFVIVNLIRPLSYRYMRRVCKGRFIDHKQLKEIIFRLDGAYVIFYRSDFMEK